MKKLICTVALVLACVGASQAQLYVGGNLNWSKTAGNDVISINGNETTVKNPSTSKFGIAPKIGYYLDDKFSIGVEVSYNQYTDKSFNDNHKETDKTWMVAPYFRYELAKFGKVGLLAEAGLGIGGIYSSEKIGNTTTDAPNKTQFIVYAAPVLEYNLTECISLEAKINLAGLNYSYTTYKEGDTSHNDHSFNLGVNNGTVLSTLSIGAIYKF